MTVKVTFIMPDGAKRVIDAAEGQHLMAVAQINGIEEIEGACGGAMACATCHLIIDPAWYGKLPPASTDENDMLDLAAGLTKTSRLGCQIKLTDAMNGLIVRVPPTS